MLQEGEGSGINLPQDELGLKCTLKIAQHGHGHLRRHQLDPIRRKDASAQLWEVFTGVGVDGVGGIIPCFSFVLFAFLRFSSVFFLFSFFFVILLILLGQGQTTAVYWRNEEYRSDPSAPTPSGISRQQLFQICIEVNGAGGISLPERRL